MIAHTLSFKLRKILSAQGRLLARRPLPFLVAPIILTVVLSYGFIFLNKVSADQDALELYIPIRGLSKTGKEIIKEEFGDTFLSHLEPTNGVSFMVLLRRKQGGDILQEDFVREYIWLRSSLESIQVYIDGQWYAYSNLCWKDYRYGENGCSPDFFQRLTERGIEGYQDIRLMTYPTTVLTLQNSVQFRVLVPLGGVRTSPEGFVRSAEATLMGFHFPYSKKDLAEVWERKFGALLQNFYSSHIEISWFTMKQFQRDLASSAKSLKGLLPCLLLVIIVFCVASCCVADWVHSKPYLAIGGVTSALIAVVSGFGFLMIFQVQLVDIVYVSPFLILSIGVDDMFLMLAAWRRTNCKLPVEERMSMTFADAAVSITITSLTDILSFLIGAFSVFPAVQYFCIYTAVSLIFTYTYQITIFGAFMVYSGIREAQNRHCFIMIKLPTSADPKIRSLWYKVFCTGGDGKLEECDCVSSTDGTLPRGATVTCEISPKDNMFNLFFQRYYAPMLRLKPTKIIALITYILYLIIAIYGTTTVKIGMNYAELLPENADTTHYFDEYGYYFAGSIAAPLEIVLPHVDLAKDGEQRKAVELARRLENTRFTGSAEFWLLEFLPFAASRRAEAVRLGEEWYGESDFYKILGEFLVQPNFQHYAAHLRFEGPGQLGSSRFFVDVLGIQYGEERAFLEEVKMALDTTSLNVTAFHASFQLAEQQAAVVPATLQTICVATAAMLIVSFLFIPKLACCFCLAACIISTNLGVVGVMALWGVRLDIVSMITVLMSIGISVDFVAHVSYFYVQAMELDLPVSKAQRALSYLGLPILQGAMSTVCGMLVLLAIQAYMIRAFVKTLLLVIFFGLYHGLLILPIALSLFIRDTPKTPEATKNNSTKSFHNNNLQIATVSDRSCAKHKRKQNGTLTTVVPDSLDSANSDKSPTSCFKGQQRVTYVADPTTTSQKRKNTSTLTQNSYARKKPEVNVKSWRQSAEPQNVDIQVSRLKPPGLQRYSEMSRTTRVLNWLLQTPAAGQYPAYSASSLEELPKNAQSVNSSPKG